VVLAAIGLIESLLTLTLIDELTDTRGRGNRECVAQGAANVVTGFFGGMGGCAMIGQSMINVNSGGRGRLSGITAALALLAFILFASGLIEDIPLAALVGVMFTVVIGTFEWSSFRILKKIPRSDAFVLILVSGVTVATDLAIAVVVGVIVSALVFAWKHAKHINVKNYHQQYGWQGLRTGRPAVFCLGEKTSGICSTYATTPTMWCWSSATPALPTTPLSKPLTPLPNATSRPASACIYVTSARNAPNCWKGLAIWWRST